MLAAVWFTLGLILIIGLVGVISLSSGKLYNDADIELDIAQNVLVEEEIS